MKSERKSGTDMSVDPRITGEACAQGGDIAGARHYTYDRACAIVKSVYDALCGTEYPCIVRVDFNEYCAKSYIKYEGSLLPRSWPRMRCQIGMLELKGCDCKDGRCEDYTRCRSDLKANSVKGEDLVRDVDLVWVCKHIAHEARHLYQARVLYQMKDLSGRNLDMARMDAVADVFHGYRRAVYPYMPSELDAEKHGFTAIVDYFDKKPIDEHAPSVLDAKACLMQRVRELAHWKGDKNASDFDSMVRSLDDRMDDYKRRERHIVLDDQDGRVGAWLLRYPKWRDVLFSKDNVGPDYDRRLLAAALDYGSYWLNCHRGLDNEVKSVRKQYPSQLGLLQRVIVSGGRVLGKLDASEYES